MFIWMWTNSTQVASWNILLSEEKEMNEILLYIKKLFKLGNNILKNEGLLT